MLSTLFRISSVLLFCTSVMANDIYINQSGDNADINITQDGQNNRISSKNNTVNGTPNAATFVGKNQDLTSTQTGDNNFLGLYKHYYGSDGQGYKISESGNFQYDGTEQGGHSMDLYVSGDRNDIILSQRSQNNTSGHWMDVNIYSDDNDVHVMQESNTTKSLTLNINNDDNNVSIHQKKSHGQTGTVTLGGNYGTTLNLQMGTGQSTQAGTYSLNQNCQTVGGCSITVTQN